MTVTLRDLLDIVGGKLLGNYDNLDTEINRIKSNSKTVKEPAMFVAYSGKNVDGHQFVPEALENGCIGCLVSKDPETYKEGKFYVLVEDTLEALWKLVAFRRKQIRAKIICVTGSVGKTTTTGMIANVLRQQYNVFETEENYNDEFLCPEMIFKISDKDEYAVLELGIGMQSSVKKMSKIIRPDIVVLTRIGYAHIEKTGSLEATRDEKCGTEDGLKENGIVVVNRDDTMISTYHFRHCVLTYGKGISDQLIDGIPKHLEYAARAAALIGDICHISVEGITRGINTYKQAPGRMDVIRTDRYTVIDASFNANVESIKMAIDTMAKIKGRHIAVVGEILEVGCYAPALHDLAGSYATKGNVDILIGVGPHSAFTANAALNNGVKSYAAIDIAEAIAYLREIINDGNGDDVIMVKGSHGSGVWKIAEKLKGDGIGL